MSKIKKLNQIRLDNEKSSKIFGGASATCNGETNDLSSPRPIVIVKPDPPKPSCSAICIPSDGCSSWVILGTNVANKM
jgi:hypothetical protein